MSGHLRLEHELKFLVPQTRVTALRQALGCLLRPDPRHPEDTVSSLYYDTADLELLRLSLDGQRRKVKIRARWYGDAEGRSFGPVAYLERKLRVGALRAKERVASPQPGEWLARASLADPALVGLLDRLRAARVEVPAGLRPVLVVRYRRRRYVDPFGDARVALDTDIRTASVNPAALPGSVPRALAASVLEVKTRSPALAPHLRGLVGLGSRRSSFSKYVACFRSSLAAPAWR